VFLGSEMCCAGRMGQKHESKPQVVLTVDPHQSIFKMHFIIQAGYQQQPSVAVIIIES